MADEKVESTPEQDPAAAPLAPSPKKKKLTDEEKYGGSGGKFDMRRRAWRTKPEAAPVAAAAAAKAARVSSIRAGHGPHSFPVSRFRSLSSRP